jgi:hypothetical protein
MNKQQKYSNETVYLLPQTLVCLAPVLLEDLLAFLLAEHVHLLRFLALKVDVECFSLRVALSIAKVVLCMTVVELF